MGWLGLLGLKYNMSCFNILGSIISVIVMFRRKPKKERPDKRAKLVGRGVIETDRGFGPSAWKAEEKIFSGGASLGKLSEKTSASFLFRLEAPTVGEAYKLAGEVGIGSLRVERWGEGKTKPAVVLYNLEIDEEGSKKLINALRKDKWGFDFRE